MPTAWALACTPGSFSSVGSFFSPLSLVSRRLTCCYSPCLSLTISEYFCTAHCTVRTQEQALPLIDLVVVVLVLSNSRPCWPLLLYRPTIAPLRIYKRQAAMLYLLRSELDWTELNSFPYFWGLGHLGKEVAHKVPTTSAPMSVSLCPKY